MPPSVRFQSTEVGYKAVGMEIFQEDVDQGFCNDKLVLGSLYFNCDCAIEDILLHLPTDPV